MVDIFYTFTAVDSETFTKFILAKYYNIPNAEMSKTINGKPYLKNDKVFFNASHSKGLLAIAVAKSEVGLDVESLSGKPRPAVLAKFSAREKYEIVTSADFYTHWTARESYIKYLAGTLAALWRRVEFVGKRIYFLGKPADVTVLQFSKEGYSFSVCGKFSKYNVKKIDSMPL